MINLITYFAIIFVLILILDKFKIESRANQILLILVIGFVLNILSKSLPIIPDTDVLIVLSLLSLLIIQFIHADNIKIIDLDKSIGKEYDHSIIFFLLTAISLSFFIYVYFNMPLLFSILFALMLSATQFLKLPENKKIKDIFEKETNLVTIITILSFIIIFDLIIIGLETDIGQKVIMDQFLNINLGIGIGLFFGLIFIKTLKKIHIGVKYHNLLIILSIFFLYHFSEFAKGNGFFAVTVFALYFSNSHVMKQREINYFDDKIRLSFDVIIFLTLGMIIGLNLSYGVIFDSLLLLMILILIRMVAVFVTHMHSHLSLSEMLFMSLYAPRELTFAAMILFLVTRSFNSQIIEVSILVMIFSIIISSSAMYFYKTILNKDL